MKIYTQEDMLKLVHGGVLYLGFLDMVMSPLEAKKYSSSIIYALDNLLLQLNGRGPSESLDKGSMDFFFEAYNAGELPLLNKDDYLAENE